MSNLAANSKSTNKDGAAIIETCLAIFVLCHILFGLLQLSHIMMAHEVMSVAAFRVARSATVGTEDDFLERVAMTATIPLAGPEIDTEYSSMHIETRASTFNAMNKGGAWDFAVNSLPSSSQFLSEKWRIPFFVGETRDGREREILDYENWDNRSDTKLTVSVSGRNSDLLTVDLTQYIPLEFPFVRAFFRGNQGTIIRGDKEYVVPRLKVEKSISMENHSNLYLD